MSDIAVDRTSNLKSACLCATVALLLFLAGHLRQSRNLPDSNLGFGHPDVTLTISPQKPERDPFVIPVRFRLSNNGTHPIFYPVRQGTDIPVGKAIVETPSSEWMIASSVSDVPVSAVQELIGSNLAWLEMPPGGSVDGEFHDSVNLLGKHIYVICLKSAREANVIRLISKAYPLRPGN